MTKNYFTTLGLKPGASELEIKKAYRGLAKKWHPDKNQDKGAEDKFKEIAAAYEYLQNEDRREILVRDLNKKPTSKSAPGPTPSYRYSEAQQGTEESAYTGAYSRFDTRNQDKTTGSFGSDPKPSKSSSSEDVKTGKKKKKTKSRQHYTWRDWSQTDDDLFDIPTTHSTPRSNFSSAFKSFVDDLGMNFDAVFGVPTFEFSSFFHEADPFTDFFSQGSFGSYNTQQSRPRPAYHRTRNVAGERGADGLDREYMFTPKPSRSDTSFSQGQENLFDENTTMYSDEEDFPGEYDTTLFKCTYCGKRLPFHKLSEHEPGCAVRNEGKFDASDTESVISNYDNEDQYPSRTTGDWRQTHEELLQHIRKAKKSYFRQRPQSDKQKPRAEETSPRDNPMAQVQCKWCGRNFSHPAAKHHVPFCEKWTKEHGTPLNPKGKTTARDLGSKNQKAREYARHIPKPQGNSFESDEDSLGSPRTSRGNFHFPDISGTKRETMSKPGMSSGTGLHTMYSPRSSRTNTTNTANTTKAKKFTSPRADSSGIKIGGYSFGVSGSRVQGQNRSSNPGGTCKVCKKRYGAGSRFSCSCGIKRGT